MAPQPTQQDGATNILPIPPPLEFPFPRSSMESSDIPSTLPTTKSSPTTSPEKFPTPIDEAKPATIKTTSDPVTAPIHTEGWRPPLDKRHLSERPIPSQQKSLLGLRRGQTDNGLTPLTSAAYHPASDASSSSSSDEAESPPTSARRRKKFTKRPKGGNKQPTYNKFSVGNENFRTGGKVSKTSGRLDISLNETTNTGYLAKALGTTLHQHLRSIRKPSEVEDQHDGVEPVVDPVRPVTRPVLENRVSTVTGVPIGSQTTSIPKLNIVVMVIGSRGDIQPFLKLGKLLKEEHGHRVRIATHPAFKTFVEQDSGLEFFSVGGDPAELMAFMVKNPGLIPSLSTVKAGEIGRKRDSMFEMFQGFWRACINATDEENDPANRSMMESWNPFVADAIIANPPSFAHVHCAERLGIPLHLMFTFPYSPTQQFPHPLANIKKTNVDTNYTNFMSYPLVEMMTWQGLGDLVNRFRVHTLGLEPVSTVWAPGQLFRMKVPYTYMWSPGLIPKPADWGPEIDIAGFVFLDLASSFKPPDMLTEFLEAGEPPVYVGFGSIVVDDPDKFTTMIFEAVERAGVRALVSKGWGGLGDEGNTPANIYMLENTPHDWLFPRVSAVVHHGGAGTTAIGLKCGKPTMIVPFFGDQPFWGAMVAKAGAGAKEPIPYKYLNAESLAEGIRQCLTPEAKINAGKLAKDIELEGDGAKNAVDSFHRHLPLQGKNSMRCSIIQDRVAAWELKKADLLQLSPLAAELLVQKKKLKWNELRLVRHREWNDFEGPGEPLTGGGAALLNSAGGIVRGIGGTPVRWAKTLRKREKKQVQRRESATPKTSTEGKRSTSTKRNASEPVSTEPTSPETGPVNGEYGMQKHLPGGPSLEERGRSSLGKTGSLGKCERNQNGVPIGPLQSSETISEENEGRVSNVSSGSDDNLAQDMAVDAGMGLAKSGEALARAPMDLSLAIAQGFHNAPRLYGDTTVRTPLRITGIKSGLHAAGDELVFGVYDGVTGLWLQPYRGARDNGALGFVQGVGKGLGGFVLKDLAAIFGPIAYTMKGVHKEMIKGREPTQFVRRARIAQGGQDVKALDDEARRREEEKVEKAWKVVLDIANEFNVVKDEGFKAKWRFRKEGRRLVKEGKFESVGSAAVELEEWRRAQRLKGLR
ncbi:MAG: hypothetical protein LQ337_008552 [Flavoplaca oasis]|nr:MAG: hypothetical protein LQ337_008552 [Flavoplaca oasis]